MASASSWANFFNGIYDSRVDGSPVERAQLIFTQPATRTCCRFQQQVSSLLLSLAAYPEDACDVLEGLTGGPPDHGLLPLMRIELEGTS